MGIKKWCNVGGDVGEWFGLWRRVVVMDGDE